jgi:hypothetical protein
VVMDDKHETNKKSPFNRLAEEARYFGRAVAGQASADAPSDMPRYHHADGRRPAARAGTASEQERRVRNR